MRFGPVDATLSGDVESEQEEAELGLQNVRSHIEHLYDKLSLVSKELVNKNWEAHALKMVVLF